jgi:hypothetical protein
MTLTNEQLVKQLDKQLAEQNRKLAERNQQLELQLRLAQKPQRQSLVESSNSNQSNQQTFNDRYQSPVNRNRNAIRERVSQYNWEDLANREFPIDEKLIPQLLQDFGKLYMLKTGFYEE